METRSNHVLVGGVVLILLAVLALFLVWISRFGARAASANTTSFSSNRSMGSPRGRRSISRACRSARSRKSRSTPRSPEFVRVRVSVDDKTPILLGTTASIQGSFTGPSTVQLDGAQTGQAADQLREQLVRRSACR